MKIHYKNESFESNLITIAELCAFEQGLNLKREAVGGKINDP